MKIILNCRIKLNDESALKKSSEVKKQIQEYSRIFRCIEKIERVGKKAHKKKKSWNLRKEIEEVKQKCIGKLLKTVKCSYTYLLNFLITKKRQKDFTKRS